MGTLQLSIHGLATTSSVPRKFNFRSRSSTTHLRFSTPKIRAVSTVPDSESTAKDKEPDEPPTVDFAFVHSVLLPDGTPDVHFRRACGGQKLRDIMLDNNMELYGPYGRPLLNCAGGGTCGTCMVEVVEGKELLTPRTDKEKEHLKKKPKNWRLACQTIVGKPDSKGLLVIQQLPEWKAHEWSYEKILPAEEP
ncbi:hypothetical protein Goklo_003300 [Gossypium klotzschianum]|uniref:2Fe-2S ferredoxin-type domain-containing protein n=1 Tax=Gossypium klotzschianum TaxID=34286 RepID=A0A7J8VWI6_9ROSI|nr:hypothetical protein [Gossypium klotzschianum]